jgi:hypothetical protein
MRLQAQRNHLRRGCKYCTGEIYRGRTSLILTPMTLGVVLEQIQMIEAFKPLAVDTENRNTALLTVGEFVLTLSLEPLLPETKCIATKALINAFPTDAATNAQLEALRIQCRHLMRIAPEIKIPPFAMRRVGFSESYLDGESLLNG